MLLLKTGCHFFKSATTLLVITIFLLFSYCPVRNALQSALSSSNKTTQHTKPGAIKTFTYQFCGVTAADKLSPFQKTTSTNVSLAFIAIALLIFGVKFGVPQSIISHRAITFGLRCGIPIYLKNRMLLI